jgi:hypothetical protein
MATLVGKMAADSPVSFEDKLRKVTDDVTPARRFEPEEVERKLNSAMYYGAFFLFMFQPLTALAARYPASADVLPLWFRDAFFFG